MKPQEIHKEVIATIHGIIDTWENTNDINSLTHECDIRPTLYAEFDDKLSDSYIERLDEALGGLWYLVQRADKEQLTE